MSLLNLHSVISYVSFYLRAKSIHSVHSPFLYQLIDETLENKRAYYTFFELEKLKEIITSDQRSIQITDLGAGSKRLKESTRTIASIAKTSVSPKHKCQLLFNLIRHLQPKSILELGTSLGMSALYMHRANRRSKLTTVEGDPNIAGMASRLFKDMEADINLHNESFDTFLEDHLEKDSRFDFIYIDGNHTMSATLSYINTLFEFTDHKCVILLDDIYWSKDMTAAWLQLQGDDRFSASIDFYHYGLLVKDSDIKEKINTSIIKKIYKPWKLGFF